MKVESALRDGLLYGAGRTAVGIEEGPTVVSHGRPPQQPNAQPLRFAGASPIGFLHIWLRLGEYILVVSQERHRLAGLVSVGQYRWYYRIRTMAYSRRRGLKPAHLDCCIGFGLGLGSSPEKASLKPVPMLSLCGLLRCRHVSCREYYRWETARVQHLTESIWME